MTRISPYELIYELTSKGNIYYGTGDFAKGGKFERPETYIANRFQTNDIDSDGWPDSVSDACDAFGRPYGTKPGKAHNEFTSYIQGIIRDNNPVTSIALKTYKTAVYWESSMQKNEDGENSPGGETDQSTLSYGYNLQDEDNARYFDARQDCFIVLPENNHNNIELGDVGFVRNRETGEVVYVIYADRGPYGVIGEASTKVFNTLTATTNNDDIKFQYVMFPGSGVRYKFENGLYRLGHLPTPTEIKSAVMNEIDNYAMLAEY